MYPASINIADKLCIVIGGGKVAERKVRGVLKYLGRVRLVAPDATPWLAMLAAREKIQWIRREYQPADLEEGYLVFAATSCRLVQERVRVDAHQLQLMVNVADAPGECDFQVPASVHRGDLILSVSTNGKSPAVAAMVRKQLESQIGDEYGTLLTLISSLRQDIIDLSSSQEEKKKLFQKLLHDDIVKWIKNGQWERLESYFKEILGPEYTLDTRLLEQEQP